MTYASIVQNPAIVPSGQVPAATGRHIVTLDGLRGIAILMVLIGHFYQKSLVIADYPLLTNIFGRIAAAGGYGVNLFFVLSGFLITGILLDTKEGPGFFRNFYMRRFLRIFPLYYSSLFIVLIILPYFATPDRGAQTIISSQVWLWTYMANWPSLGWIWDDSNQYLLGHFWSLCVEEHFYVFWPFVVWLLRPRQLVVACTSLVVLGLVSRASTVIMGAGTPLLLQWSTLHNLDGLVIGSAIAACFRDPRLFEFLPRENMLKHALLALGLVTFAYVWLPRKLNHPAFGVVTETLFALFFGLALLAVVQIRPSSKAHYILSSRFLVALGKYSYGLYVIHGILRPQFSRFFDFSELPPGYGLAWLYQLCFYILAGGTSFALAFVSYQLFEKRFLALKRNFSYK